MPVAARRAASGQLQRPCDVRPHRGLRPGRHLPRDQRAAARRVGNGTPRPHRYPAQRDRLYPERLQQGLAPVAHQRRGRPAPQRPVRGLLHPLQRDLGRKRRRLRPVGRPAVRPLGFRLREQGNRHPGGHRLDPRLRGHGPADARNPRRRRPPGEGGSAHQAQFQRHRPGLFGRHRRRPAGIARQHRLSGGHRARDPLQREKRLGRLVADRPGPARRRQYGGRQEPPGRHRSQRQGHRNFGQLPQVLCGGRAEIRPHDRPRDRPPRDPQSPERHGHRR